MLTLEQEKAVEMDLDNYHRVVQEIAAENNRYSEMNHTIETTLSMYSLKYITDEFSKLYRQYDQKAETVPLEVFDAWIMVKTYKIFLQILKESEHEYSLTTYKIIKFHCEDIMRKVIRMGLYAH